MKYLCKKYVILMRLLHKLYITAAEELFSTPFEKGSKALFTNEDGEER